MKLKHLCVSSALLVCFAAGASGQYVTLNPNVSRVLGQPQVALVSDQPNLVEGRELNSPQGIVIDPASGALYVADTANNRVLAWRNAGQFSNGAPADLVVGQRDKYSTSQQGPGRTLSVGFTAPTGLAFKDGSLYVVDTGNNRILRFPSPFSQTDIFPDMVIGQTNFTSRQPNMNGPLAANAIFTSTSNLSTVYRASLAFDASGNLWFVDAGNRRVLRYKASDIGAGTNAPAADLVLGQVDFTSIPIVLAPQTANLLIKDKFDTPSGLAFDPAGRLYVSDSDSNPNSAAVFSRVLVFTPPFSTGMQAARIMGVVAQAQGGPPPLQTTRDRTQMVAPEGIFMIGNKPAIADSLSSRILVFDPFDQWPAETLAAPSPMASSVIGQKEPQRFDVRKPNGGDGEPSAGTVAFPETGTVFNNDVFIVDSGNNRVLAFPLQPSGFYTTASRVLGQDGFNFNSANLIEGREFDFTVNTSRGTAVDGGIAIDLRSDTPHLYVADTNNNRVLAFADARKVRPGDRADLVIGQPDFTRALCNYPSNDADKPTQSSLCQPTGVTVDSDGNLWVADSANARVLRFPNPFTHQAPAGSLQPADLVIGQSSFTIKFTDPTPRTMRGPYSMAFSAENGLLVSDVSLNRVLYFPKTNGTFSNGMSATKVFGQSDFVSSAPSLGGEPNRMNGPHHIAADSSGRFYVADTGNNRVLVFDDPQSSSTPAADAQPTLILTGLRSPRGVFVNQQTGEVWVADTASNRALRFPAYDRLLVNPAPRTEDLQGIPDGAPFALSQDSSGALYVADGFNRIAIFYPGLLAVNGANFIINRALTPGVIATVYPLGNRFGEGTEVAPGIPLPTDLADIQVLVNDQPAPLYYVSPTQINFVVPWNTPTSGTVTAQIGRKSSGQTYGIGQIFMNVASPGIFRTQGSQAAVLNQDGTVNGPTNPESRGRVISIFGTGHGPVSNPPPDGQQPGSLISTPEKPRIFIGSDFVGDDDVLFSGLSPDFPGMWQINVRIPSFVAPGNATVLVVTYRNIANNDSPQNRVTIAVKQ